MKKLTSKAALRLWTALCAVAVTAALLAGATTTLYWDDLWYAGDFFDSTAFERSAQDLVAEAQTVGRLSAQEHLNYMDSELLAKSCKALDPAVTNFRCQIHTQEGALLWDNLEGASLDAVAKGVRSFPLPVSPSGEVVIEYGALGELTRQDIIWAAAGTYGRLHKTWLPLIAAAAVAATLLALWLLAPIWKYSRRSMKENGPRWLDNTPLDLCIAAALLLSFLLYLLGRDIFPLFAQDPLQPLPLIGLTLLYATVATIGVCLFSTTFARWGAPILRKTLIYKGTRALVGTLRRIVRALPFTRKPVLLFLLYLVLGWAVHQVSGLLLADRWLLFPGDTVYLLLTLYHGTVLLLICRWVYQWRRLRDDTSRLLAGELDSIPANHLPRDLRDHAEVLNGLGRQVAQAVERETKSQRFQAELITNVSHDLKSPLTSIINYVDLLKNTSQTDPAAAGYIDVLDRKSHRLKRLTEDLVEASKASTGVLPVSLEALSLKELVDQALAEYRDRLADRGLEPVVTQPAAPITVLADGRHLWRVLDNLLGNCVKYALPGTRVYLELTAGQEGAAVTVKNVSAQPLNMTPEELMTRFVRGDLSRSTEGTGLGLSIAQSLTELQGGAFRLDIDGDLFKAEVALPYPPEAAP